MPDTSYDFGGNTQYSDELYGLPEPMGQQSTYDYSTTVNQFSKQQGSPLPQVIQPNPLEAPPGVQQPQFKGYGVGGLFGMLNQMKVANVQQPQEQRQPVQLHPMLGGLFGMMAGGQR